MEFTESVKSDMFYAGCNCCSLIHQPRKFDNFEDADEYAYNCIIEHNNVLSKAYVIIPGEYKTTKFTYRLHPIYKTVICTEFTY